MVRSGVALAVALALWPLAAAHAEDPCLGASRPVIDVHLHAYDKDPRWDLRIPSPSTGKPLEVIGASAHLAATLDELRRANVVRGIVSGDDAAASRMVEASHGRVVIGFDLVEPSADRLAELRRLAKAGRLAMIGEVGAQYAGIAPDDPRLEPLWALAEEFDLPVGFHIHPGPPGGAYQGSPALRARLGDPLLLEEVLIRHPRLRIFVMHAGWPRLEAMIALMHAHPQVYVDVAVLDWAQPRKVFYDYLERLIDQGLGKRILFGSDQMVWTDAIGQAVASIEAAPFLSDTQKRDILFNNAVRFFRWKDLEGCA